MQPMANMALRAARNAGDIILRAMDRIDRLTIEEKGRNDLVSQVDRDAEAAIIDVLHTAYPDHGIVGEENGELFTSDEYTWIIDPLDGTTNYLYGIPHFCISIALKKGHNLEQAVIFDPVRNEEFVASRGSGAQLNGKRIRVSPRSGLESAILNTGIPPRAVGERLHSYMGMMEAFTKKCHAVRRMGSAALDLAYVAAGRVDGFWEYQLKPWDIAAGALLVREAGGFVSDFEGGDNFLSSGNIIAANQKCFKPMISVVRAHDIT